MHDLTHPLDETQPDDMDRRLREAGAHFRRATADLIAPATAVTLIDRTGVSPAARVGSSPTQRRQQQRRRAHRPRVYAVVGATVGVLAIIGAAVLAASLRDRPGNPLPADRPVISASTAAPSPVTTPSPLRMPSPRQVLDAVTKLPAETFTAVGPGATTGSVEKIRSAPALTAGGKPEVFYYGAEFCPYCAAERWAIVAALSRFGTWSNLNVTTSASRDVYPRTPTFTFYRASYASPYIAFSGVETTTNQLVGNEYRRLQTPTMAQQALVEKYDIVMGQAGSMPFVDFGNRYKITGSTYDPQLLQGRSLESIAAAIADPSTAVSKGVLGSANRMTAAICNITDGRPGSVCEAPVIQILRSALAAS